MEQDKQRKPDISFMDGDNTPLAHSALSVETHAKVKRIAERGYVVVALDDGDFEIADDMHPGLGAVMRVSSAAMDDVDAVIEALDGITAEYRVDNTGRGSERGDRTTTRNAPGTPGVAPTR